MIPYLYDLSKAQILEEPIISDGVEAPEVSYKEKLDGVKIDVFNLGLTLLQMILDQEESVFKNYSSKDKIYSLLIEDVSSSFNFVGKKFFSAMGKLFAKKVTKFNPFTDSTELPDLLSKMLHPNPKMRANLNDILQGINWLSNCDDGTN